MASTSTSIDPGIFRAYDIRGVYGKNLTRDVAERLPCAFLSYVPAKTVVVGRDARASSPALAQKIVERFSALGVNVKDIGVVSTDVFYYACGSMGLPGIMVTASHNPPEYNGFKLVKKLPVAIGKGQGMEEIKQHILKSKAKKISTKTIGRVDKIDIWPGFIAKVFSLINISDIHPLTVVIDAANGMAGVIWEKLQEKLPVSVIPLFFTPDGTFPNHEPDPLKPKNREDAIHAVKKFSADVGFAFDADVDRCFVIDNTGAALPAEFVTALLSEYFLEKRPKQTIVYDVRSSWVVKDVVKKLGGKAVMGRVGHAYMKKEMQRHNAVFGGELSGHFYFRDFYFSDSGIVTSLILLALLSQYNQPLSKRVSDWRRRYFMSGEINFKVADAGGLITELKKQYHDGTQLELDGLSVEYDDWHFNVRSSNTEPFVRLNVEAKSLDLLTKKKEDMISVITKFT